MRERTKAPTRRAVALIHIVDRDELLWIPPLVQRAKVEAYVGQDFELVEILSDGFESAADTKAG